MLRILAMLGWMSIALSAQQPSEEDLAKLAAHIDKALGVRPGMRIADIGTGLAIQHPIRIARGVAPEGSVTCVEISQAAVDRIRNRVADEHIANMNAQLGKTDDPLLAAGQFDAILISNAYHEFGEPQEMLKHICDALKADGTLVVVENYSIEHRKEARAEQAKRHDMAPEILERELAAAGFTVKERVDPVLVNSPDRMRYLVRATKTQR
jgi:tRNA A58 N-methylase Trm61